MYAVLSHIWLASNWKPVCERNGGCQRERCRGREGAVPLTHVPAVPCLGGRAPAPRRQEEPIGYGAFSIAFNGTVMGFS